MKSKRNGYRHYSNRQAIIASLSGLDEDLHRCASCINWNYCSQREILWLCQRLIGGFRVNSKHYKPVKIRKTTMRKLLKRRRAGK